MATYYHGGNGINLHSGLCLVDDERAAGDYAEGRGGEVVEVEVDLSGLNVVEVEVTREMIDNQDFPGDTAKGRAAMVADGVDAIKYDDMTPEGRTHRTLRLLSPKALAAVTL
jgi:hypothetical protein